MVVYGEYLTLDVKSRRTSGHVFVYYIPGSVIYHFTNLIVGKNIHLQTMSKNKSTKVRYFFPHSEHKILMEIIRNKEDPDGYIERDLVIALTLLLHYHTSLMFDNSYPKRSTTSMRLLFISLNHSSFNFHNVVNMHNEAWAGSVHRF